MFTFSCITEDNLKININVTIGDMVAATLSNYNEIHRAVILDKGSTHFLKNYFCFFVDIGCKEYVDSNHIFYLLEEAKNVSYSIIYYEIIFIDLQY